MKRLLVKAFAAAAVAAAAGCASVEISNHGADTIVIQNSGGFLFYCIPLFSGDPDYPNQQVCNWFSNTVKVETNIRLLNEEAERQGARGYRNLASHPDDETIIFLLLKRKMYRTSAELVK
ncbi:MAG: hypothetical protein J6T01_03250 [Kiritimatiellae bacterium]|nr:hypothetical protein [Kiritimatiellia bacterium]